MFLSCHVTWQNCEKFVASAGVLKGVCAKVLFDEENRSCITACSCPGTVRLPFAFLSGTGRSPISPPSALICKPRELGTTRKPPPTYPHSSSSQPNPRIFLAESSRNGLASRYRVFVFLWPIYPCSPPTPCDLPTS